MFVWPPKSTLADLWCLVLMYSLRTLSLLHFGNDLNMSTFICFAVNAEASDIAPSIVPPLLPTCLRRLKLLRRGRRPLMLRWKLYTHRTYAKKKGKVVVSTPATRGKQSVKGKRLNNFHLLAALCDDEDLGAKDDFDPDLDDVVTPSGGNLICTS